MVVPARDEAERLGACLDALERAADAVPGLAVHLLVVLDRCRDASADVVAAHPRVRGVPSTAGSAGGARRLGVAAGLSVLDRLGRRPERVWVASTDADSTVPRAWLAVHAEAAAAGAELLLGTVVPQPREVSPDLASRWAAGYRATEGHRHVHAANLGVRASSYRAVGGFPPVPAHEDVALARALEVAGARVVRTARAPVVTSGRLRGRAPEGFAVHLAALAAASPHPACSTSR